MAAEGIMGKTSVRRFTQKHPKIPKNTPEHPKTLYSCTEKYYFKERLCFKIDFNNDEDGQYPVNYYSVV
jgi:hypothetical protein